jgi:hypothetical protein
MNTRCLIDFPFSALQTSARLLTAYCNPNLDFTVRLGKIITPEYNDVSGFTFLVDSNFRVAMLDEEGHLQDWYVCGTCFSEGFFQFFTTNALPCCRSAIDDDLSLRKVS